MGAPHLPNTLHVGFPFNVSPVCGRSYRAEVKPVNKASCWHHGAQPSGLGLNRLLGLPVPTRTLANELTVPQGQKWTGTLRRSDSGALSLPGGHGERHIRHFHPGCNSQDAGAGGADEGAHRHVDIGRAALVAVEAFPIRGQAGHLPEHLQMSLLLLSLRARRHGRTQRAENTRGVGKCWSRYPGKGGCLRGRLAAVVTRHLLSERTDCFFYTEKVRSRAAPTPTAPPVGLEW